MILSRRRFSKGLAALIAMIAVPWPMPRRPDPSLPVPCGSLSWDDPASTPIADIRALKRKLELENGYGLEPPKHANCRCALSPSSSKDIWDAGGTFVPADPPTPYIVSNDRPDNWMIRMAMLKLG